MKSIFVRQCIALENFKFEILIIFILITFRFCLNIPSQLCSENMYMKTGVSSLPCTFIFCCASLFLQYLLNWELRKGTKQIVLGKILHFFIANFIVREFAQHYKKEAIVHIFVQM